MPGAGGMIWVSKMRGETSPRQGAGGGEYRTGGGGSTHLAKMGKSCGKKVVICKSEIRGGWRLVQKKGREV